MKTKALFIIAISILIVLTIDLPISKSNMVGIYSNNNFTEEPFYAEIPYTKDTLALKVNGSYESNYFGVGKYKIHSGFFANRIDLRTREFQVVNKLFRPVKIILVRDLEYYYNKIN